VTTPTNPRPAEKGDFAGHNRELIAHCEQHGIKAKRIADLTNMSVATATNWLNGKMLGNIAGFEAKLRAAFDRLERQSSRIQVDPLHVRTSISEIVEKAFETALYDRDLCTLTGPAGCGKTIAMTTLAAQHPGTVLVPIFEYNRTRWGIQRIVCEIVGADSWEEAMRIIAKTAALLMFDDAQKLCNDAKWLAIDAHKEFGIGLLFGGNEYMLDDIRGITAAARRRNEQRARLIGAQFVIDQYDESGHLLPLFDRQEVRQIVSQHGAAQIPQIVDWSLRIANLPGEGHLGTLRKVLLKHQKIATKNPDPVSAFCQAWSLVRPKVRLLTADEELELADRQEAR
jgi:transcriptional regulator with XRE-family HTH domain